MRRYIEIYSIMLRNSLIRDLSFKANFLLWMVVEILWFCGQIVFFSISFWIVRAQGLVYGYFNFLNIARYPDVIFPWLFRLIFGWVIPVVIIANIPARLLIKSFGQPVPLMLHLIIASTIVFWLTRAFWKFALGHYSSASS